MKILGVIPARMASSRFHGKPLALIKGKTMIERVYENASRARTVQDVVVATDDAKIFDYCVTAGMKAMMTSADHKNCSERTAEIGRKIPADYYAEIQGDEPVLYSGMIDEFIEKCLSYNEDIGACIACTHVREDEDVNNINLVKIAMDGKNNALFFSRCPIPLNYKKLKLTYYKQIGLYLWKGDTLQRFAHYAPGLLERAEDTHTLRFIENHIRVKMIYTPKTTVSVDVPEDIKTAEDYLEAQGGRS